MALNVIFATPEALPFAKTGGLADVAGALPLALKKLGCKVSLFLPYYREVGLSGVKTEPTGLEVVVPVGRRDIRGQVLKASSDGVAVYFIKRDEFFDRSCLYGTPEGDYFDNLERFMFFSRGVMEALKAGAFKPDIIHCNDWQTGLIPAYLKDTYRNEPRFSKTAAVFTIHNIAYQGLFPSYLYGVTNLSPELYNPEGLEFWGKLSLLKAGIVYSEIITTVSPAYSSEIQTPEYGGGLEGLLKKRKDNLYGVLNGVDYGIWDPRVDKLIPSNYSAGDLSGKAVCKRGLLRKINLGLKDETPLIGMISRLADQKGFDILSAAMPELMKLDVGFVILGSGELKYQKLLEDLASRYPGKLSVNMAFDNTLSHMIEAGCDMLLMPSKYEPCGLNQIYSLRYGTIPVVRATGGLDDTVRDYNGRNGNGFKFKEYSSKALINKVKEAISAYKDKKAWEKLQKNAMKEDFSWESAARKYIDIYGLARKKLPKT